MELNKLSTNNIQDCFRLVTREYSSDIVEVDCLAELNTLKNN